MFKHLVQDQNREYHLSCKIKTGSAWWKDGAEKQNLSTLIFLCPKDATETDYFYSNYLPSLKTESVEMTAQMAHPVSRRVRLCLNPANKMHPEGPYLHLMDLEAVGILKTKIGETITVVVISEVEEAKAALLVRR